MNRFHKRIVICNYYSQSSSIKKMNFYGYYILNLNPTVLAFVGKPALMAAWMKPQVIFEHIPWWHGQIRSMVKRKVQQLGFSVRGVEHHLFVHAHDEDALRSKLKVRGKLISQNVYVDERTFMPLAKDLKFDAVYIARLMAYKRIHLAAQVERLAIITGGQGILSEFCPSVSHAFTLTRRIDSIELASMYAESACSLALSEVEGGMLASFESLLCGIPVVSTESKGGRDLFFNSTNSIITPPEASAVKRSVHKFASDRRDREYIRAIAIRDLVRHRIALCQYLSDVVRDHGGSRRSWEHYMQLLFENADGIRGLFVWADRCEQPEVRERISRRLGDG